MPEVYAAICKVMKEIGKDGIAKNKRNTQGGGYNFRGIDDMYNCLNTILAGAGLCILPRMTDRTHEERSTKAGGVIFYATVRAEFDFVAVSDGSMHTLVTYGEAMDTSDKATNKAMSAAYKYACMQAFCIPTEGLMEDADSNTHEVAAKPQKAEPTDQDEHDQLMDTIQTAASNWLTKFIAIGRPDEFKRVLFKHKFKEIIEIPVDRKVAEKLFDEFKEVLRKLKAEQAVAGAGPVPVK